MIKITSLFVDLARYFSEFGKSILPKDSQF